MLDKLPSAAAALLEEAMLTNKYQYQSDFARRYFAQGEAEGRTEGRAEGAGRALLTILDARGFEITEATRAKINECDDVDQLDAWARLAVTAEKLEDLGAPFSA